MTDKVEDNKEKKRDSQQERFNRFFADQEYEGPYTCIGEVDNWETDRRGPEKLYDSAISLRSARTWYSGRYGGEDRLDLLRREIQTRLKICQHEIFTIGELLYEVKKIVETGGFQSWIEENLDISYYTAYNFMNVYKYCLGFRQVISTVKPSILYKISSPSFPEEFREYLFGSGILENITHRGFKNLLDKYREGGFEAVEEAFEGIAAGRRLVLQTAYSLDQLEMVIRKLEDYEKKVERHGLHGPEEEGDEIVALIYQSIQESIQKLHATKEKCWEKVHKAHQSDFLTRVAEISDEIEVEAA